MPGIVSLTTSGAAYNQNFDTLSNVAGSTTNALGITGWFMDETGGGARDNDQYGVDTGSSNTGDTYSYGAAGSTDRALGALRSGTAIPNFGANFSNDTGGTISSLLIGYTGEQWRLGTAARTDGLNFQISFNATGITDNAATWTGVSALNFVTPFTTTAGARDGNAAVNRTALSFEITSLNIANGANFWIRWVDIDATGADDGLAIDDFSITATSAGTGGGPGVLAFASADVAVAEGNTGTTPFTFTVNRTGGATGAVSATWTATLGTADATDFAVGQVFTGTVNFADGQTTATITLGVRGDTIGEANDTFSLALSAPTGGATLGTATANGTITNDDIATITIAEIQGVGHTSGFAGQSVVTNGIVTAVDTNGFWIQMAVGDGNTQTSDGIFVFTSSAPPAAAVVGNAVQVAGTVTEFQSSAVTGLTVTQISGPTVTFQSANNPLPTAILFGTGGVNPPSANYDDDNLTTYDPVNDAIDFYEQFEGMRVTVDAPRVVGTTNSFGETWVVASNGANATGNSARGGITISAGDLNPERIQIDADSGIFAGYNPAHTVGDRLASVNGIFNYAFDAYEVLVTDAVTVTNDVTLTDEIAGFQGDLTHITIATYNMENLDPSDNKYTIIASDIVVNLRAPDIIGAQEIQDADGAGSGANLSGVSNAQGLITALSALGFNYAYVEIAPTTANSTGGEPNGNIRNGYFYRTDRVQYVTNSAVLIDDSAYTGSRRPLVADFVFNGLTISVVNMHSTSRGGSEPLFGDNQPPVNAGETARNAQAAAARAYVNTQLAANPALNIAVLGDFNGFYFETSLQNLTAGGVLTNLNTLLPVEERYSYLFDGNLQQLDNIMVTSGLVQGANYDAVHLNAETPASATRPTDHDPQVASLFLAPIYNGTAGDDVYTAPANVSYTISGNDGNDTLTGNASGDAIFGGNGADRLDGAAGNDTLVGGLGADTLIGGAGSDTADYSDDQGAVFVNLGSGLGFGNAAAGDIYSGIENVTGSRFGDTLIGDGSVNVLNGGDGDDVLIGGAGADTLNGGNGSDTASYEDNQGYVFVNLTSGDAFGVAAGDTYSAIENLTGGAYADVFIGTAGANVLNGGDGNDILLGALGADTLIGGTGIDTASYEDNQGAVRVDLLNNSGIGGAAQGDTYSSIENVTGTAYQDILIGDNGVNGLDGAAGNDILIGGNGADILTGGAGADSFRYLGGETGLDRILDFTSGSDTIFIVGANFGQTGTATFQTGTAATAANATFLYDTATGIVSYDADGSGAGAAVQLAQLNTGLSLSIADFVIG